MAPPRPTAQGRTVAVRLINLVDGDDARSSNAGTELLGRLLAGPLLA